MSHIPVNTSVKDLLLKVMPEITVKTLSANKAESELAGTELSMAVDSGNVKVSYALKNGKEIDVKEGLSGNPMLLLEVSENELERMIKTENLDLLLGMLGNVNMSRYNAIKSLKGSFVAEISDGDFIYKINVTMNGAKTPNSIFKMSMSDSRALVKKETNPVNLFMSGAMKIDGDMAFAMATQPLFT